VSVEEFEMPAAFHVGKRLTSLKQSAMGTIDRGRAAVGTGNW